MNQIELLLKELKDIIQSYDESQLEKFEGIVYELHQLNDYKVISGMLPLMKDDFEFDELMFSIIHTAEAFEDDKYISELFETLPDFIYTSPRWASMVFMRILNSDSSSEVFKENYMELDSSKRQSIIELFTSMSKIDDEINRKVSLFLS